MQFLLTAFYLTSTYPLARAWALNRTTSLGHAVVWVAVAWLSWLPAAIGLESATSDAALYGSLCLTGCAAVAVLGARRPLVGAWNYVLIGLLVVLLLPLAESALHGKPLFDPLRFVFLGGTLAVGVLNYLPTRLWCAVMLAGLACAVELGKLSGSAESEGSPAMFVWLVPIACWVGLLSIRRNRDGISQCNREWLDFRDRFGLFWGQRVREQFNRAAENAGLPAHLFWSGLKRKSRASELSAAEQTALVETLRAMLKRFGSAEDSQLVEQ
jgi:hypothetical protein